MSLPSIVQLVAACVGILGSLFFAIGIIRQSAVAMAKLSYTYWDSNPHMPAVLAAQKADYVFGGGLIVAAFILQLASFFTMDSTPVVSEASARALPWVAIVSSVILFFVARWASGKLARRYQTEVEEVMRREQEEQQRKEREEREARQNAT